MLQKSIVAMTESQTQGPTSPAPNEVQAGSSTDHTSDLLATLAQRSVPIPVREEARRVQADGGIGSQRAVRLVFNAAVCKKLGLPPKENFPVTKATSAKIPERVRTILSEHYDVERGEETHMSFKEKRDLSSLRRSVERCFPALLHAENQWAADGFIQEAMRSDRKKRTRSSSQTEEPGTQAEPNLEPTHDERPEDQTPKEIEPESRAGERRLQHAEQLDLTKGGRKRAVSLPGRPKPIRKTSSPRRISVGSKNKKIPK